ncbi:MAG: hypothetical protein ACK5QU_06695, partial [Bacteroidota bacterium]
MYLIADSGSTKCDWMLLKDNNQSESFSTMGFNPFFHNESIISNAIKNNEGLFKYANEVELIFLYSAGCSSKEFKLFVERVLREVFSKAHSDVEPDL